MVETTIGITIEIIIEITIEIAIEIMIDTTIEITFEIIIEIAIENMIETAMEITIEIAIEIAIEIVIETMSIICQYFAKNLAIIRVLFKRFPQTPLDVFQVQQQVLRKRLWIDNQYAINNDGLHRRSNHFAVWWTGHLRFCRTGHFHFSFISNDGSIKLLLVNWVSEFVFRWVGL